MEVRRAHEKEAMTLFMEAYANVTGAWEFIDLHGNASIDFWIAFGDLYDINMKSVNEETIVFIAYSVSKGLTMTTHPDNIFHVWTLRKDHNEYRD